MNFIPNVSPKVFTLSAVAIGYLLIDSNSANEQNALGNWLMLVAQVLCTNAYFLQVQDERNNMQEINDEDTIEMLQKMVSALSKEIDNLKKNL